MVMACLLMDPFILRVLGSNPKSNWFVDKKSTTWLTWRLFEYSLHNLLDCPMILERFLFLEGSKIFKFS